MLGFKPSNATRVNEVLLTAMKAAIISHGQFDHEKLAYSKLCADRDNDEMSFPAFMTKHYPEMVAAGVGTMPGQSANPEQAERLAIMAQAAAESKEAKFQADATRALNRGWLSLLVPFLALWISVVLFVLLGDKFLVFLWAIVPTAVAFLVLGVALVCGTYEELSKHERETK
jgi:hypothetical protein